MKKARAVTSIAFLVILFLQGKQAKEGSDDSRALIHGKEDALEVHCSRERSRVAWKIIEDYLTPFVEQAHYQIPIKCRLHHDNDIFRDQEEHKVHVDTNEWQCSYCKKSFYAEKFLDQHFDSRHYDLLNVLRKTKCNPAAVARNRHYCESLADNCFPINQGPSASRLHEFFLHQFCDAHTCSGKLKPFSRGGKKETSVLYLATAILTLMLLPIFYVIVFLHQREMRMRGQVLKRISPIGRKAKPS
ncbi:hypothetical protein G4B88_017899 [Cannabis sativa]|uniref:C2H2-type domain-containing protein n=1 Tax=Cannabis sativa TaxID=3483 RepID=A0A7J6DT62_CANSA|nr:hypothetical protein G4B88_025270 [Cannabis sativa]KAF4395029.1 hypothetical protein G4B88_017899 [Cannabis sativa]